MDLELLMQADAHILKAMGMPMGNAMRFAAWCKEERQKPVTDSPWLQEAEALQRSLSEIKQKRLTAYNATEALRLPTTVLKGPNTSSRSPKYVS